MKNLYLVVGVYRSGTTFLSRRLIIKYNVLSLGEWFNINADYSMTEEYCKKEFKERVSHINNRSWIMKIGPGHFFLNNPDIVFDKAIKAYYIVRQNFNDHLLSWYVKEKTNWDFSITEKMTFDYDHEYMKTCRLMLVENLQELKKWYYKYPVDKELVYFENLPKIRLGRHSVQTLGITPVKHEFTFTLEENYDTRAWFLDPDLNVPITNYRL